MKQQQMDLGFTAPEQECLYFGGALASLLGDPRWPNRRIESYSPVLTGRTRNVEHTRKYYDKRGLWIAVTVIVPAKTERRMKKQLKPWLFEDPEAPNPPRTKTEMFEASAQVIAFIKAVLNQSAYFNGMSGYTKKRFGEWLDEMNRLYEIRAPFEIPWGDDFDADEDE